MTERSLAFFFLEGGGGRILIRSVFCSEFTALQLWPVSMPCAAPPACKLGMSGGSTKLEEANACIVELGDQEAQFLFVYLLANTSLMYCGAMHVRCWRVVLQGFAVCVVWQCGLIPNTAICREATRPPSRGGYRTRHRKQRCTRPCTACRSWRSAYDSGIFMTTAQPDSFITIAISS